MRKILFTSLLMAAFFGVLAPALYAEEETVNTTITLDGEFSEWENVPTLLTHERTPYPNFLGTTYYWNNDTDQWQMEALDNACMYNEGRSLDLTRIKFANNSNYLYFYWEKTSDYTNYFWKINPDDPDDNSLDEQSFAAGLVTIISDVLASTPPCLGESIYLPVEFNHDKVFKFDTNLDGSYDYYLVMNIYIPYGTVNASVDDVITTDIYRDDGNGLYDGRDVEALATELGSDYEMEVSATACADGVCQEGRLGLSTFFEDIGVTWGDAIWVGYESHSDDPLFRTAKSLYAFNKNNSLDLAITTPKKNKVTHNKKITVSGEVKEGSVIRIFVNGERQYKVTAMDGTYSKLITLKKGANAVVVKAKKGEKSVVQAVKVRRK